MARAKQTVLMRACGYVSFNEWEDGSLRVGTEYVASVPNRGF